MSSKFNYQSQTVGKNFELILYEQTRWFYPLNGLQNQQYVVYDRNDILLCALLRTCDCKLRDWSRARPSMTWLSCSMRNASTPRNLETQRQVDKCGPKFYYAWSDSYSSPRAFLTQIQISSILPCNIHICSWVWIGEYILYIYIYWTLKCIFFINFNPMLGWVITSIITCVMKLLIQS